MLFLWLNPPGFTLSAASLSEWLYWSLSNDLLVLLVINVPWLALAALFLLAGLSRAASACKWPFLLVNLFVLLLNLADAFYFRFQRQRANADLLYVIRYPFHKTIVHHPWMTLLAILVILATGWLLLYWCLQWQKEPLTKPGASLAAVFFGLVLGLFVFSSPGRQLPAYPLASVSAGMLPYVQNSFHCLVYSVYRNKDGTVGRYHYMPKRVADSLVTILAANPASPKAGSGRNVVLFIMESVPYDFFDSSGRNRLSMPFLDSLRRHSIFFDRAYAYSHQSNKGIAAVLAGMPTLTEIPLYHSGYTSLPATHVGTRLSKLGYRSLFFIGDDHDDFGFAKCVNWLGFSRYFSKEDIPGYRNLESHTMGLHDEYVLKFMNAGLQKEAQPFFAVHFNTSTHYPNDLPKAFEKRYAGADLSPQMKSMLYYDECLSDFFAGASLQAWFSNTVFIFCSDHWMYPDSRRPVSDEVSGFRIPIMVYDPRDRRPKLVSQPVSQFDVMNTVLQVAGDTGNYISFGRSLLPVDTVGNRLIVSRENASLYQVFSNTHVLGYNPLSGRTEFCYRIDDIAGRRLNLAGSGQPVVLKLESYLKAFLQRSSELYLQHVRVD